MAYAGFNTIPFGGYGGFMGGRQVSNPGYSNPFLNNPLPGQQGYNAGWDPVNWNPNLANVEKWLGYSPTQQRQGIAGVNYTPPTPGPETPTSLAPGTGGLAPPSTTPTIPGLPRSTVPGNGPIGIGMGIMMPGGIDVAHHGGSRLPNRLVPGAGPGASPGSTTPTTTTQSPNSDFLGALQTAIDSLGNLAPNINPNPTPQSQDYSFNANAPSGNNWSSYVNMLGYN